MQPDPFDMESFDKKLLEVLKPTNQSVSTIQVNAGGVGIWVAVSSAIAMLVGLVIGCIFLAVQNSEYNRQFQELRQKDEVLQAYINAGYLQPKEQK